MARVPSREVSSQDPFKTNELFGHDFDRFFKTHERVMWRFDAIDFTSLRPELLKPEDVDAVRAAMLVESHIPVYASKMLEYFRADHEMASFVIVWAYEEMKHYGALRTFLEATNLVDGQELERELTVTRAGDWGAEETAFSPVQSYTYTMLQEQITSMFYRGFAKHTEEPLLRSLLGLIAKDEARHCQYYLAKAQQELARNPRLISEVDDVLLCFRMPGPTFVPDYEERGAAMASVAGTGPGCLKETLNKIGQLTGKLHLLKLATDRAFRRKLADEWKLDLGSLLGS